LKDLGGDVRVILKWIFKETGRENVDRIDLPHYKAKWLALVNKIMNLWVP
jgi:hypothetical protein